MNRKEFYEKWCNDPSQKSAFMNDLNHCLKRDSKQHIKDIIRILDSIIIHGPELHDEEMEEITEEEFQEMWENILERK